MVYLLSALLAGGVLTVICWPLFARSDAVESAILEETEWDLLQRRKDVVLGNIQDLDFEYQCGKHSAPDYQKLRAELTAEAARVYTEIDRIESSEDLDALIRTEVAARKSRQAAAAIPAESDRRTCPGCGHANPSRNKFCAECGIGLRS